jgi:hypothetical protein
MTPSRILIVLTAALGLGFYLGPFHDRHVDEDRLAGIATVIAGREVGVSCPGPVESLTELSPNAGSVRFAADGTPGNEAKLSTETCARLRALLNGDIPGLNCLSTFLGCPEKVEEAAAAVNVLSHEAWHLAGVRDEAVAQCYAVQTNVETAIRLGADREDAEAIAEFALLRIQPALPPEYRSDACHDGSPLDLNPQRPGWP